MLHLMRRWYPVAIALLFTFDPYTRYDISPADGVRILVVSCGAAIAITWICTRILDTDRGAAVAALLMVGLLVGSDPLRIAAVGMAIALVLVERRQSKRGAMKLKIPWPRIGESVAVLLVALVALEIGRAALLRLSEPTVVEPVSWTSSEVGDRPDIFVILADGHGRSDVLAEHYAYDSTEFRSLMEAEGFRESTRSVTNHTLTRWAFSVLLNGRPLEELGQDMSAPANELLPIVAVRDNSVVRTLRRVGYRIVTVDSGWAEMRNMGADETIASPSLNELERNAVLGTAFGQLLRADASVLLEDQARHVVAQEAVLEGLATASGTQPLFVFAHLPVPHSPFVFDSECRFRPLGDLVPVPPQVLDATRRAARVAAQSDQTACVDRKVAAIVKAITSARPNAVILVLSDHGPDELVDSSNPTEPGLGNRVANMFWARTPDHPALFPEDVSLVNVFPLLFNAYFGMSLPTHQDDVWIGPLAPEQTFTRYFP